MRIALILADFPSLSQTFVLNQITGLIDRGHDVEIFAERASVDTKVHQDVKRYNLLQRTCYHLEMSRNMPKNKLNRILKGIGCIIKYLPMEPLAVLTSLNIFKYGKRSASFYHLFQIIPFLDRDPYDIIQCHFGPYGNYAVMLKDLGAITGKIVTTFHGYDLSTYIRSKGNHIYEELFAKGDLFLPISERWKEKLIKLGCPKEKIIVHRMGIDIRRFSFTERKVSKYRGITILTVARLVEKKGVKYGIQAFAELLKIFPEIQYVIVGDGPLRNELLNLVSILNLSDRVKLLGWKNQEEIAELMTHADILLAPSVTSKNGDQEGIPVVLMEALARGLPVVSTYHSGIPELVEDGVSGFLVPERNVDFLADRLRYLIDHPDKWSEMGHHGRKYVEKHYDINKLNDQLVNFYYQLLDG